MSPDKPKENAKPKELAKSKEPKKTFYRAGKKIRGDAPENLIVPKSRDVKKK